MAAVLQLTHLPQTSGDAQVNINLLNESGWYVCDPGWVPKTAEAIENYDPLPVVEVLKIASNFATQDALAAALISVEKLAFEAARFRNDRQQVNPPWLYDQLASETGGRRAAIRRIALKQLADTHGVGTGDAGSMIGARPNFELAIEREPWWERTSEVTLPQATPAAAASIVYDYTATADIVGDSAGRISFFSISSGTTYQAPISRVWMGIRSANKHGIGVLANFQNIWECEAAGATLGTDAARAADTTASPGGATNKKVTITPGTATWAKRLTITLGDVIGDPTYVVENYGNFLWLLRTQVSSGTWEIQLRFGYENMADADFVQGPVRQLTNTAWDYVEMATYEIPLRNVRGGLFGGTYSLGDIYWTIQIWARRTVGTGTLDLDCLCPIPIDEGFLKAWGFTIEGDATDRVDWIFMEAPDGTTQWIAFNSYHFSTLAIGTPATHNFRLPPGDGRIVMVYARATSSVLTDRLDYINYNGAGKYYPRWLVLRGAE